MFQKIVGKSVLIVGDLHFSDVFQGKHKDYLTNSCWVLNQITLKVEEEKPKALLLLGDLVGWMETNVKHREVLAMLCKTLRAWNAVCPVYAVRGNHDMKGYPDFNLLADLGLIITSDMCGGYFDYYGVEGQTIPEVRFHLVDYKNEDKVLQLAENGTSNIVLAHNNFTISGVTNWYQEHDGIELAMLSSFNGVDMVISGHIHNPSPEIYSTKLPDGTDCMLFYPGCPARPIKDSGNMYESCWYVSVVYNEVMQNTDIIPIQFPLLPSSDIFFTDDEFITEQSPDEVAEQLRREGLQEVLNELVKYRVGTGDPIKQVENITYASEEAKKCAIGYLQKVVNNGQ